MDKIQQKVLQFSEEREWRKQYLVKDLAISISLEANELLENFQWENISLPELLQNAEKIENIKGELADIFIYLTYIIDKLDLNLETVVSQKLSRLERKYPVEAFKNNPNARSNYLKLKKDYRKKN